MSRLPVSCSAQCTFLHMQSWVKTSSRFFATVTDDTTIGWICESSKMKTRQRQKQNDKPVTLTGVHWELFRWQRLLRLCEHSLPNQKTINF